MFFLDEKKLLKDNKNLNINTYSIYTQNVQHFLHLKYTYINSHWLRAIIVQMLSCLYTSVVCINALAAQTHVFMPV